MEKMEREQITLRIPWRLKKALEERADKKGISLNAEIVSLLLRALEGK